MSKPTTVDARLRRNRRIVIAAFLPSLIPMTLAAQMPDSVGMFGTMASALGGMLVVHLVTRPLWALTAGRLFGVRPRAIVFGSGRFVSASAVPGRLRRVRRASLAGGWTVVATADSGVARVRMWLAYAIPVLLELGLCAAVWHAGPSAWGPALAGGMLLGVLGVHLVLPGVSPTAGWMLFRLPRADSRVLDQVTFDAAEERAKRASLLGDLAEWRTALAEGSPTRAYTAALSCELALAEGRYADCAAIAEDRGPQQPDGSVARAIFAQHLVRARCYAREATGPRQFVAVEEIEEATILAMSSVAVSRATDAPALYWIARGDTKPATRAVANARSSAYGPHGAAHVECTQAVLDMLKGRPAQAESALARARQLAPDMPRIAAVERWYAATAPLLGAHAVTEPFLDGPESTPPVVQT